MNALNIVSRRPEFKFWLLVLVFYGVPNLVMYLTTLGSATFYVDTIPVRLRLDSTRLLLCISLVFLSLLFVIACTQLGARFFPAQTVRLPSKLLGIVVFLLQLNGLLVLLLLDFGRVGGTSASSSVFALFVSYLSPDAVFLAYYGHARSKKVPYVNLLLFLVSNVMRGWGGVWTMLIFIEFYYVVQRFSGKKLIVVSTIMLTLSLALLPVIIQVRDAVRGTESVEKPTFSSSVEKMFDRLQQFTAVALIAQEAPVIERAIAQGKILPVYADNQIFARFGLAPPNAITLQKVLSVRYLVFNEDVPVGSSADELGWFVHTGIAGWLFVISWSFIPVYILFVGSLILLPYWIAGKFIGARSTLPILHILSVLYVFHGWFSVHIGFCIGLSFYAFVLHMLRKRKRRVGYNPAFVNGVGAQPEQFGLIKPLR